MVEITAETFSAVYNKHRRGLLYQAWKVLRCPIAAEDAVQEAMCRAWGAREQYSRRSNFLTWLIAFVFNVSREHSRRIRRPVNSSTPITDFTLFDPGVPSDRLIDAARIEARVEAAFGRLKPSDQTMMRLRFHEGMEPVDIASFVGRDPAYVRVRLMRATAKVRVEIGPAQ